MQKRFAIFLLPLLLAPPFNPATPTDECAPQQTQRQVSSSARSDDLGVWDYR